MDEESNTGGPRRDTHDRKARQGCLHANRRRSPDNSSPKGASKVHILDEGLSLDAAIAAAEQNADLLLGIPGKAGFDFRGVLPRRRASFRRPFVTVFPDGLAFAIQHLTHRQLRVLSELISSQPYGEEPNPLSGSRIAKTTGLTPSAVSEAISRMQKLGVLLPGRTIDGKNAGLRFNRRILFRGKAFQFIKLPPDPELCDPKDPRSMGSTDPAATTATPSRPFARRKYRPRSPENEPGDER